MHAVEWMYSSSENCTNLALVMSPGMLRRDISHRFIIIIIIKFVIMFTTACNSCKFLSFLLQSLWVNAIACFFCYFAGKRSERVWYTDFGIQLPVTKFWNTKAFWRNFRSLHYFFALLVYLLMLRLFRSFAICIVSKIVSWVFKNEILSHIWSSFFRLNALSPS